MICVYIYSTWFDLKIEMNKDGVVVWYSSAKKIGTMQTDCGSTALH